MYFEALNPGILLVCSQTLSTIQGMEFKDFFRLKKQVLHWRHHCLDWRLAPLSSATLILYNKKIKTLRLRDYNYPLLQDFETKKSTSAMAR